MQKRQSPKLDGYHELFVCVTTEKRMALSSHPLFIIMEQDTPPKPYGYRWGVLLHNYEISVSKAAELLNVDTVKAAAICGAEGESA